MFQWLSTCYSMLGLLECGSKADSVQYPRVRWTSKLPRPYAPSSSTKSNVDPHTQSKRWKHWTNMTSLPKHTSTSERKQRSALKQSEHTLRTLRTSSSKWQHHIIDTKMQALSFRP